MSRLRSHERRLHAGLRYWCTECQPAAIAAANGDDTDDRQGVGFATYSEFQAHTIAVHPPVCSQCSRAFESRHALKAHVTAAHSEVPLIERKKVVCDHPGCGRGFTKQANLKVHQRTIHDGERAAICGGTDLTGLDFENWGAENACGRAFKNKGTLEEHVRTQHLGLGSKYHIRKTAPREKEEGVAKKERKALKAILALTGEGYAQGRDIECTEPGCAFRFIRNYDLSVHLASKHGKNDIEVQEAMMERNALSGGKFWNSWVSEEEIEDEQTNDEVERQMIENLDYGDVDKECAAFWTSDERMIDQSLYENHINLDLTETIPSEVESDATGLVDPLLREAI
ncbi:MAG: Strongly-conserved Zn-finger binding protein (TFIIIA) [Vezdaea acicularis]|nr:MAG: Strongly-conserved Zn-finger binding protein (TFIIIA) [Vezdaea acicularis]